MALISCPECGRQVSSMAPACPECGYPINQASAPAPAPAAPDRSAEIAKNLDLAIKGIQGQNSDQVEKYTSNVLEIDPTHSRAWELQARGILFGSTLRSNKIPQATSAAVNAIEYYQGENKAELAISLYDSIAAHINGLLSIAINQMPVMYAPQYVAQCMNYFGPLLCLPCLPKEKLAKELSAFDKAEEESKKAIMPKKRMIFASHATLPSWPEQYRALLREKGII